jgi:hypothetical protein
VAFARLLQEQERAFYERRVANAETPRREYGGDDDETDCAYDAADNDETSDDDLRRERPEELPRRVPRGRVPSGKRDGHELYGSPVRARATRTRL